MNDVVKEKLMKKSADLDTLNDSHNLQESTTDCCTYLGDAEETGIYSPQPLPLVNYAQDYALDATDGDTNFITPPKKKRLSITAVSAPSKKSNKVRFTTPTGEELDLADTPSSPPDDANYDNDIFTQQTTPSSRKRSAADTTEGTGKRVTKRRKTAGNNVIITPPNTLNFDNNNNEQGIPEIDDSINDDEELEKIIG